MSVVPIMYDFAREMEKFKQSIFSDDFGLGLIPQDFFDMTKLQLPTGFINPQSLWYPFHQLHQIAGLGLRDENEKMTIDKDGFQLTFDAKDYKPNELKVKIVNNFVVVEGKHEERKDDRNFTRKHFLRTYLLPIGYNPDEVVSTISPDGVLCVKVPPPQSAIKCNERTVKIEEIGTTYL